MRYQPLYGYLFSALSVVGFVTQLFLLSGCKVPVTGSVQLPEGSPLALDDLKVVTSVGEVPVADEGSFSARESGASPALAFVTDASGKPVLLGFVTGGAGSEISARSTAVALLFQALGAFTLPRETWPQALELLAADPSTAALAKVAAERLAADPHAISNRDATLLAALSSAVAAILGSANSPALIAARAPSSVQGSTVRVTAAAEEPALVLVQPTDENSGVRAAPNAAGNGITITNNVRRHLWAYTYQTGWKTKDDDENAAPHSITPWKPVKSVYIPAVNGFQGTIGTLLDAVSGQVAYSPVTSEAIILPVAPASASQAFYTVVVVGPAWKSGVFSDELPAEYAEMAAAKDWRAGELRMGMLTLFQEFIFPAVLSVLPTEALGRKLNSEEMGQVIDDISKMVTNLEPQFAEQLSLNDYKGAMITFFKGFDNALLRSSIVNAMIRAGMVKGGFTMAAAACLDDLNMYVAAIDKFLSAGDLGIVTAQLASCKRFMQWSATAALPVIRIQNNPSTVTAGLDVKLTCYGVAGIAGTKEYHWKTPAAHGHLADSHGNAGADFTSSDQIVSYVADDDAQDGDQDTVSVTASLWQNSSKTELGSATATVFIVDAQRDVAITPASPAVPPNGKQRLDISILPSLPGGAKVAYTWTCTSAAGTLRGPLGNKAPFTGAYATYSAGGSPGMDTVTVSAWRITGTNLRVPIGTASATVRVSTTRTVIYTKEPYEDENGGWYAYHGIYLIFPAVEGSYHYSVLWHANGAVEPAEWASDNFWRYPWRTAWDGQVAQYCGYGMECFTTPESMERLGVAEDPNAALRQGEVAVPMYGTGSNSSEEVVRRRMDDTRKFVEFFIPWTGDVTGLPY